MKGGIGGVYECAACDDLYYVSDEERFGGEFMPAAFMEGTAHPSYWRGKP